MPERQNNCVVHVVKRMYQTVVPANDVANKSDTHLWRFRFPSPSETNPLGFCCFLGFFCTRHNDITAPFTTEKSSNVVELNCSPTSCNQDRETTSPFCLHLGKKRNDQMITHEEAECKNTGNLPQHVNTKHSPLEQVWASQKAPSDQAGALSHHEKQENTGDTCWYSSSHFIILLCNCCVVRQGAGTTKQ